MSTEPIAAPAPQTPEEREAAYVAVDESEEFQSLRHRYRRFVFPVTAGALAWYFTYVLLAAYAPGFMSEKLFGNVNVGLVMGLLQFVSTFAITAIYVRYADTHLDPAAARIREHMREGGLQ
ncbi:MAG: DUF485 domain-containing protein [Solirubrobacteraceae bacterium]|nr:DUF485 domain-containing protein [Solirubrobacteraceae bacterium]